MLRQLLPVNVAAYLRAQGWKDTGQWGSAATLWESPTDGPNAEILAPSRTELADYALRMAELIVTLAHHEDRPVEAVFRDLSQSSADVIRARVQPSSGPQASVSLDDGLELVSGAREMLMAAACAALEPKRAYPTRRPAEAAGYLDSVRLGQTELGSYVVTLLSPVTPALHPTTGQAPLDIGEPYPRRVVETLVQALADTRTAAIAASRSGQIAAFEQVVDRGVSADLCGALARMAGPEPTSRDLEISVTWSPRRIPADAGRPVIRFPADLVPVVSEAARVFRESSPEEECEVIGVVTRLHRDPGADIGRATITGVANGKAGRVAVTLEPADYERAIHAHEARSMVTCWGDLVRRGSLLELRVPHDLRVIDQPATESSGAE